MLLLLPTRWELKAFWLRRFAPGSDHDWRAMSKNANYTKANTTRQNRTGVDPEEREELLLDDLRHEVSRLADAVERQNELLNESTSEADFE